MATAPSYGDRKQLQAAVPRSVSNAVTPTATAGHNMTASGGQQHRGYSDERLCDRRPAPTPAAAIETAGTSAGGTFSVAANRQWTPTGIRVNQGEVLRFTSSGEIRFTGDANDRAGRRRFTGPQVRLGAPLPNALAGRAHRPDRQRPAVRDRRSVVHHRTGKRLVLHSGTNDDNVSDNSGQFQVVISFGR